jgi:hypothetical protein
MSTRKIRPQRKTRHLLPFAPDSAVARSYRPTEVLQPMPPMPPAEPLPTPTASESITIESEQVFPSASPEVSRRRHQSQDNLQLEKKSKRQTRNLAGRGWT